MNSILDDFKMAFRSGNILNQIIVINLAVFACINIFVYVILTLSGQSELFGEIYAYLSLPSNPSRLIYQPLSFFTYMFLHQDFFHILFNMLFLYWFGRIIVEYLGQNKILGLYVLGGLSGGLFYILLYNAIPFYQNLAPFSILAGASAGVLAVVVGAATFQPDFEIRLLLLGAVKLKFIAVFVVLSSFLGVVGDNAGGEIAHLGGALLGYLFMVQLKKGNDWSKPIAKSLIWVKSFFIRQPKIKVSYKNEQRFGSTKSSRKTATSRKKSSGGSKQTSQAEIDAILDKISESGYDALSKEEKQKLFNASNK